jgi:preprotein translocase subunit SecD
MNRYPVWKYVLIVLVLLFGALYTIPNFFGESPAVQISTAKATIKLGPEAAALASQALEKAGVRAENVFYEDLGNNGTVRVRFASTDLQFKAKTVLEQALNSCSVLIQPVTMQRQQQPADVAGVASGKAGGCGVSDNG